MGVVAEQLERALEGEVQRKGLLFWHDPQGLARPFADQLAARSREGSFPYPVVVFDGSFVSTLLALEPHLASDVVYLLVHVSGLDEAAVRRSPLLEIQLAGRPPERSIERLVREAAAPHVGRDEIDRFLAGWDGRLEVADRWVTERATGDRRVLGLLDRSTPADLAVDLVLEGPLVRSHGLSLADLEPWLQHAFGLAAGSATKADDLMRHLLLVEFIHDLAVAPPSSLAALASLPKDVVEACRHTLRKLRSSHPVEYERRALDVEAEPAGRELAAWAEGKALGRVDTFRFEDRELARQALAAIERDRPEEAAQIAADRLGGDAELGSFWVTRDPLRRALWAWVRHAAELLDATRRARARVRSLAKDLAAEKGLRTHREVLDVYAAEFAPVDRAHRVFEQHDARLRGLHGLSEFARTRAVVRHLREVVRHLLDEQARWFADVCDVAGPLPPSELRQRSLFDEEVQVHLKDRETTAWFVVDALRYELGVELLEALGKLPGLKATLRARFAELPSETFVGMNALPPVVRDGKLVPVWDRDDIMRGFRTGEFTVSDRTGRMKATAVRVGRKEVPWLTLDEVVASSGEQLREVRGDARALVVHSREIDEAGHAGLGVAHFETLLEQVVAAVHRLTAAGVRRFLVTSDHGFLLGDESARLAPDTERPQAAFRGRYAFTSAPDTRPGWASLSLAALGYQVEAGRPGWLLFPRDTRVTGTSIPPFVHGGNTLQERVIPVLHAVVEGAPRRVAASTRRIVAELGAELFGARELVLRVAEDAATLSFMGAPVDVALRCDVDGVSVTVANVSGGELLGASSLRIPSDDKGARAWFRLEGPADGRARVIVYAVSEGMEPVRLDEPLPVHGRGKAREPATASREPPSPRDAGWLDELPSDLARFREVLSHLDQHGTLFEEALVTMLGGPPVGLRLQRRLATLLADAGMRRWLPFDIEIHDDAGKRSYVKQARR